ncbi:DUF1015 domain-containing protein [Marinilabilia rubra]|uniref:DUF1015 domain-containing protein n=1 Tax=Marinilabilia rubra TaxID=2162893 RepID=A0A2U2B6K4_9BACT|nr:DUF1015 family protein [Marinilabilia rubra]PWD98672.1 DUF1015 domain-containing protein [Marinilabilia rubra]
MAIVKPFNGLRPPKDIAAGLSCLPYDVMNSQEAAKMAGDKDYSLLHITRAEIDCEEDVDVHSDEVYEKSAENLNKFKEKGWLAQDEEPRFYIYAQTMNGRTQYGIVGCASCTDYEQGVIKKHELTRPEKEEDRMVHIRTNNANLEPVFFSYKAVPEIDEIVNNIVTTQEPEYDFTAGDDGFGHHFWVVWDAETNTKLENLFSTKVPCTYVADGHHRTAAAARVGLERKAANPNHTGNEEYNFFMAVHFPDDQLEIIDYNRVVKDLNNYSPAEFVEKLSESFDISEIGSEIYKPSQLHEFSMYLDGKWYKLTAREGTYNDQDPIGVLDVTILSNHVLDKLLGIKDLRTSKRIDFVGGIRGLGELQSRVDSGEMKVAFALYPVSMQQLIDIADTGNIMPPKTTWFEPKLRSGLVIHEI